MCVAAQVNAMLYDWVCEGTMGAKMDCDFERLDLSTRPFLDKSMVCAPPYSTSRSRLHVLCG
jgi:hypothetical protein